MCGDCLKPRARANHFTNINVLDLYYLPNQVLLLPFLQQPNRNAPLCSGMHRDFFIKNPECATIMPINCLLKQWDRPIHLGSHPNIKISTPYLLRDLVSQEIRDITPCPLLFLHARKSPPPFGPLTTLVLNPLNTNVGGEKAEDPCHLLPEPQICIRCVLRDAKHAWNDSLVTCMHYFHI